MKMYLVRHGETEDNLNGIAIGQADSPLTENGILQAKNVAEFFKCKNIDAIFSSDLGRCIKTAEIIKKYHCNVQLYLEPLLRERDIGKYTKMHKTKIPGGSWADELEGGESLIQVMERAEKFLEKICGKYDSIVVVSHAIYLRMMMGYLLKKKASEISDIEKIKNAEIVEVEFKENELEINRINLNIPARK